MKENIEVNKPEDARRNNPTKRNINVWGIYISLVFIIIGIVWYGVNVGLIPLTFIQQQAGPIIIVLIGLLILLKSLKR
jgi:hypothetical protein